MSKPVPSSYRIAVIAGVVVLLHVAVLWALQSGLLRRVAVVVVPVQMVSVVIAPEVPQVLPVKSLPVQPRPAKPSPAPVRPAAPTPATVAARPAPTPTPAPQPVATAEAVPTPASPAGALAAQSAPSAVANTGTAQAAPAAPKVELPSTNADYLNNPKPVYPVLSKRVGEQGRVLVHVLIGPDGLAQRADIKTSSGFERLDRAALATVLTWRYVPGKRAGVAEAMWFNVPINFVLE